jgi:5'(3')-deoxyribonucleotidase
MEFTQSQQNYLETIGLILKRVVEDHNIPQSYFEKHFTELFTAAHNYYQNFLQRAMNDEELKAKMCEDIWNELRKS